MRILSVGNFSNPSWDGSLPDEEHIAKALENLGHDVIRLQREQAEVRRPPEDYDFILIAQWNGYPEDLMSALKSGDIPIVYWAFDYQAAGQPWHEQLVQEANLYLSKRIADSKYPNWRWLSQDFAPSFLSAVTQERIIEVLFTGSYLPWAEARIETLREVDKHFQLVIHSFTPDAWKDAGFKNVYGPIMDRALPEVYSHAKINLSIDHTLEAGYWSDRNAQIMACGGFVLFRYVPLSATVFRDNIAYFYGIDDCLGSIQYYLEHEEARENIATQGLLFAHSNLMVDHRVKDLLTIVGEIL